MNKPLTQKQIRFIHEYLNNGFNATDAAIKAGYSQKTAALIGHENLRKPNIEKEINRALDEKRLHLQRLFIQDAEQARRVMYDIMKDPKASHRDKLTVAKDFLDRAGFKAAEKRDVKIEGEIRHEDKIPLSERIEQYTKIYAEIEAEEAARTTSHDEDDHS